jgi:hypothetical protein
MPNCFAARTLFRAQGDMEFGNPGPSVFTPVLAKHTKSFSLIDCLPVGVNRMQRTFDPMRKQVEVWQRSELTDLTPRWRFMRLSSRENWKLPNTLHARYTTCTSNRSMRIFDRERFGVFQMLSSQPSKKLTRFRDLGQRRSWEVPRIAFRTIVLLLDGGAGRAVDRERGTRRSDGWKEQSRYKQNDQNQSNPIRLRPASLTTWT